MDFSHNPLGPSEFAFSAAAAAAALPSHSPYDPAALPPAALHAQQPLPNPTLFDQHNPLSAQPPPNLTSTAATTSSSANPAAASATSPQVFPPPVTQQRAQKKNSYPCPLSKQYNCSEFFTTSGHAARHAKKHTGKKDALCPECGKGFTRKDNMEQHRRTHANGRNTNGAAATHNSTSSSSSNNASTVSNASSASSAGSKAIPKPNDSEESKARRKTQQQRKARPSSISTSAPVTIQAPLSHSQPSTGTTSVPPTLDMLDPALREQASFFSPSSTDYSTMFPFSQGGYPMDGTTTQGHQHHQQQQQHHFQAPHAPMRASASSAAAASRMRHEPRATDGGMGMARPRAGPTSPSLAPKLDALALVAEGVRRRDSNDSDSC